MVQDTRYLRFNLNLHRYVTDLIELGDRFVYKSEYDAADKLEKESLRTQVQLLREDRRLTTEAELAKQNLLRTKIERETGNA